jgi:hypothetical protein
VATTRVIAARSVVSVLTMRKHFEMDYLRLRLRDIISSQTGNPVVIFNVSKSTFPIKILSLVIISILKVEELKVKIIHLIITIK